MIARLGLLTPFIMVVPDGADFTVYAYQDSGYMVYVYPPERTTEPFREDIPDSFEINGKPGFAANGLRIDFVKDEFDRSPGIAYDPPAEIIARAVSSFLKRYRYISRAAQIDYDLFPGSTHRLAYLNDDGTELQKEEGKVRARMGRNLRFSYIAQTPEIFEQIHTLDPDWEPPRWHDLLLDAEGALPKVGTAVVLAATALEVFVADILNALAAKSAVAPPLWQWINDRDNWLKDPSTTEQFDFLLKFFVGHSLMGEATLWPSYKNLRDARNSFVHGGSATIGKNKAPVDSAKAAELVGKAREITAKIREWLPPDLQWPDFPHTANVSFEFKLADRLQAKPPPEKQKEKEGLLS